MIVRDFDNDGDLDVLGAGNLYASEVETPRADAGVGVFLKGNGKGEFTNIPVHKTGALIKGDVKDLEVIKVKGQEYVISVRNNDFLEFIKINNP